MTLDSDLVAENGLLLLSRGQYLSPIILQCLQRRYEYCGVEEMVSVKTPKLELQPV